MHETVAQHRTIRVPTMSAAQTSIPAFDTVLRQGPAPQPPSTRRPRRTGQPQRACGRSPPARSRFAAPITPAPQASCRIPQARRNLPGRRSPRHPLTALDCPAARSRRVAGSAGGDSAASPRMRPCGGWKGPGLRRAAHAPPAGAATPRPAQVRARIAGADRARSHPRLRSEPERAARTRRRGAGDSESAARRIGAPLSGTRRRTARPPAPPQGRGAGPIRRGDLPTRIAAAASCGRGRLIADPGRAARDSRPPAPALPIRFTADRPACRETTPFGDY